LFRPPRLLLYTFFATASEFFRRSIIVITIIICLHQPVKLAKNYSSISTAAVDSFVKNVRICLNIIQSLKAYCNTHTRARTCIGAYRTHIYIHIYAHASTLAGCLLGRTLYLYLLVRNTLYIFSNAYFLLRQLCITRSARCRASEKRVCFKR